LSEFLKCPLNFYFEIRCFNFDWKITITLLHSRRNTQQWQVRLKSVLFWIFLNFKNILKFTNFSEYRPGTMSLCLYYMSVSHLPRWCELDSHRQLKTVVERKFEVRTRSEQSSNSHGHARHDTDKTVLSCLVWPCELSRPDRQTGAFCVGSASECVGRSQRSRRQCRRDAGQPGTRFTKYLTIYTIRDAILTCARKPT